jgi:hypothetical protein
LVTFTTLIPSPKIGRNHSVEPRKELARGVGNTNVAIASAVTAYSRMIINQYKLLALNLGLEIYYSDTDSLVLNGKLPEEYISNTELGKLKLEYKFKEGIFVMPKVYCLNGVPFSFYWL